MELGEKTTPGGQENPKEGEENEKKSHTPPSEPPPPKDPHLCLSRKDTEETDSRRPHDEREMTPTSENPNPQEDDSQKPKHNQNEGIRTPNLPRALRSIALLALKPTSDSALETPTAEEETAA